MEGGRCHQRPVEALLADRNLRLPKRVVDSERSAAAVIGLKKAILLSSHGGIMTYLFIASFLARCALIGARAARRCSLAKRRAAFTSLADSDPGHLEALASLVRQHNKLLRTFDAGGSSSSISVSSNRYRSSLTLAQPSMRVQPPLSTVQLPLSHIIETTDPSAVLQSHHEASLPKQQLGELLVNAVLYAKLASWTAAAHCCQPAAACRFWAVLCLLTKKSK